MMDVVSTDLVAPVNASVHPLGQALLEWCDPICMMTACGAVQLSHVKASNPDWKAWMDRLVALVDEIMSHPDRVAIVNTHNESGHHALISFSKYHASGRHQLNKECWLPIYDLLLSAGLNPVATESCVKVLPQLFAEQLEYLVSRVGQQGSEGVGYLQEEGGNLLHFPFMFATVDCVPSSLVQSWLIQPRASDGALPLHLAFREWMQTMGEFPDYLCNEQYTMNPKFLPVLLIPLKAKICELALYHLESRETPDGPALYELIIQADKAGLMEIGWPQITEAKGTAYATKQHTIIKAGTVVSQDDPIPQKAPRL